jgi:hypothetical protein
MFGDCVVALLFSVTGVWKVCLLVIQALGTTRRKELYILPCRLSLWFYVVAVIEMVLRIAVMALESASLGQPTGSPSAGVRPTAASRIPYFFDIWLI